MAIAFVVTVFHPLPVKCERVATRALGPATVLGGVAEILARVRMVELNELFSAAGAPNAPRVDVVCAAVLLDEGSSSGPVTSGFGH